MYINNPMEIENKSMDIIEEGLNKTNFTEEEKIVVKRTIHTTGDLDYQNIVDFKEDFVNVAKNSLKNKVKIYTDTNMTKAGVNKKALEKLGLEIVCYIADEDVAKKAKEEGTTRSQAAIEKAIKEGVTCFSIGNAPTALYKLLEEYDAGRAKVDFVIGVPVGFVGAAESKEDLRGYKIPQVTTIGNKGGSNVAASIINALMYMLVERWKN